MHCRGRSIGCLNALLDVERYAISVGVRFPAGGSRVVVARRN